jgi:hypothetical protein
MGLGIAQGATNMGLNIGRQAGGNKKGLGIAQQTTDSVFKGINGIIGGFGEEELLSWH